MPILQRTAAQGVRLHRDRVQGERLLQDRQPLVERVQVVRFEGGLRQVLGILVRLVEGRRRVQRVGRFQGVSVADLRWWVRFERDVGLVFEILPVAVYVLVLVMRDPAEPAGVEIAVIGGSGFYSLIDGAVELSIDTPYGPPASPVHVGDVGGRPVAFIARHGTGHTYAPHEVPYQANLWALASLGATRVIGFCASGSLRAGIAPGDLVVVDQLVDRTWGRPDTFVRSPDVDHVSFAEPYCAALSGEIADAAREGAWPPGKVHRSGTVVVVQGPRFSTRAESRFYAACGFDVINMTQHPEAYLARELGLCYSGLALVTDYDAGLEDDPSVAAVSARSAFEVMAANVDHARSLLGLVIPALSVAARCDCAEGGAPSLVGRM